MAFENIAYIDKFPLTYSLSNEEAINWNVIGMKKFRIYDSLLVVSTTDRDGFWSFYNINIHSSDGKWGKTICEGKADDIGDLEDKIKI